MGDQQPMTGCCFRGGTALGAMPATGPGTLQIGRGGGQGVAAMDQKMCHHSIKALIPKSLGAIDGDGWEKTGCSPETSTKGCNGAMALI